MYSNQEIEVIKNKLLSNNYKKDDLFILSEINNILIYGNISLQDEKIFIEKYKEIIEFIEENKLYKDNFEYLEYKAYFYFIEGKTRKLQTLINSYRLFKHNELLLLLIELLVKNNYDKDEIFEYVDIIVENTNNINLIQKIKDLLGKQYNYSFSKIEIKEIEYTKNDIIFENKKEIILLCLANSKKYNERCVAGIVIELDSDKNLTKVTTNWIRPISNSSHCEISTNMVKDINIFDLIKITYPIYSPNGYQKENYLVKNIEKIKFIYKTTEINEYILYKNKNGLFGNESNKISSYNINNVKESLLLLKPIDFKIIKTEKGQIRGIFKYINTEYNLPITDIDFINTYGKNIGDFTYKNIYLTISLGVEFHGYHYKLIAGILLF